MPKFLFWHFAIVLIRLLLILSILNLTTYGLPEILCDKFAIDIRNDPLHISQRRHLPTNYTECTVLEGSVTITMILQTASKDSKDGRRDPIKPEDFPVFENLREITGHLLVYQVEALDSLGRMFPNLRVIGGRELILNYALVIYQNRDLRTVGLTKLSSIRGGVRIAENAALCYADTVNWKSLIVGNLDDVLVMKNHDVCMQTNCASKLDAQKCQIRQNSAQVACWNKHQCQIECNCANGRGCIEGTTECCHDECMGGCSGPSSHQCYACRNVYLRGECRSHCPDNLYLYTGSGRRCVTAQACLLFPAETSSKRQRPVYYKLVTRQMQLQMHLSSAKMINLARRRPLQNLCTTECPANYTESERNARICVQCQKHCPKKCPSQDIRAIGSDTIELTGCNVIEGSLTIELSSGGGGGANRNAVRVLKEALRDIYEVTGYVRIAFVPQLFSLEILDNLRVIGGKELYQDSYALVVVENEKLRTLVSANSQLQIKQGGVQIQNNPYLCMKEIRKFLTLVNAEYNELEQSSVSNGYKEICEEMSLRLTVSNSLRTFILQWTKFNATDIDHRKFLGYRVYYRTVEKKGDADNIYADRNGCYDSWQSESADLNADGIFLDYQAYDTWHAFYVKTVVVSHNNAVGAISEVAYEKSFFGVPSKPSSGEVIHTRSSGELDVHWQAPARPNGNVTHYRMQIRRVADRPLDTDNPCDEDALTQSSQQQHRQSQQIQNGANSNGAGANVAPESGDKEAPQGTCSAEGCCPCSDSSATDSDSSVSVGLSEAEIRSRRDRDDFENAVQNRIFYQGCKENPEQAHCKRQENFRKVLAIINTSQDDLAAAVAMATNGVSTNFLAPAHFFKGAKTRRLQVSDERRRRRSIRERDEHPYETMDSLGGLGGDLETGGALGGHGLDIVKPATTTPKSGYSPRDSEVCVSPAELAAGGKLIREIRPGTYTAHVRAVTLFGPGDWSSPGVEFTIVGEPILSTLTLVLLCTLIPLLLIALAVLFAYWWQRRMKSKIPEYIMQMVETSPEYMSLWGVYKPDEWELDRAVIKLECVIGRGTFGQVYKGFGKNVTSANGVVFGECAVKCVAENASQCDRLAFLHEAMIMKSYNTAFIVKLFGVVSNGQPALVVMELMQKGNLRDYLRSRRPGAEENTEDLLPPTLSQIHLWAAQIADGMAYLEAEKFCHRDLAARNCMVSADLIVKIGDFGMARDVYVKDYYRPTGKRLSPVRWMSPEALMDAKFTSKSDVWAYGVVLWEMVTLGHQPYPGVHTSEIQKFVVDQRGTMANTARFRPQGCPKELLQLMEDCWRFDYRDRPTFADLARHLAPHTNDFFKKVSFTFNHLLRAGDGDSVKSAGNEPTSNVTADLMSAEALGEPPCPTIDTARLLPADTLNDTGSTIMAPVPENSGAGAMNTLAPGGDYGGESGYRTDGENRISTASENESTPLRAEKRHKNRSSFETQRESVAAVCSKKRRAPENV